MNSKSVSSAKPEVSIALSPELDVAALRAAFAHTGRLHVPHFLAADSAERIARAFETDPPWALSVRTEGKTFEMAVEQFAALDPAERAPLDAATADGLAERMQYRFDTWRTSFYADTGRRIGTPLETLYDFMNTEPFLDFVREVTGDPTPVFCDAQATRYRPGCFLTAHNDASEGKNRLYAYVMNFTRQWRRDWGGLLQFYDERGHVAEAFTPAFNALNLFSVPREHAVSYVAPYAAADRLSVTGWVRGGKRPRQVAMR
jgi:SM-20-related protein